MSFTLKQTTKRIGFLVVGIAFTSFWHVSTVTNRIQAQEVAEVQEALPAEIKADEDAAEENQDDEVVEAQVAVNAFGVEPGKMIAAKRFQLTQIFLVEIEEIQRLCDLDKSQSTKLRIGAKGAVKKLTAEWKKKTDAQMGQFPQVRPAGEDEAGPNEAEDIEFKDADEIDEMTLQMVMMNGGGNPFQFDNPREHKFWLKTVENVLTETQAQKLDEYKQQRAVAKRNAMIESALTTLTMELGLTKQQRKQLAEIIVPPMRKADVSCYTFYEPFVLYYHASKADVKKIDKVLSPGQLQKWKIFIAPSRQIGEMIERDDAAMDVQGEDNVLIQLEQAIEFLADGIEALLSIYSK